jgi:hypothetical protein
MKMSNFLKDVIFEIKRAKAKDIIAEIDTDGHTFNQDSILGIWLTNKMKLTPDSVDFAFTRYNKECISLTYILLGDFISAFQYWHKTLEVHVKEIDYGPFTGKLDDQELNRLYRTLNRCIASLEQEGY